MSFTYLQTAFRDRERVKALGARWDPVARRWYVPAGIDLGPFAAWLPESPPPASYPLDALEPSRAIAAASPASTYGLASERRGIGLAELLAGVADAVAQAYRAAIWTIVDVVKADLRRGHVYLELAERDPDGRTIAQARGLIWADVANAVVPGFERATGVVLGAGIKLLVRARPNVHALYGLSLVIDAIDPDYTLGDLEARRREIRDRLRREGLIDLNRELPPPWDYRRLLVVAPEAAAGLGDFAVEARRIERHGLCKFDFVYRRFQGEGAAAGIAAALEAAKAGWSEAKRPDAVAIIRGGGAVNDLAWLDDYALARAICELPVPMLSGIGHERDNTLVDEVAHQRFDTPSKLIAGIEQSIVRRARDAKAAYAEILRDASAQSVFAGRRAEHADAEVRQAARRQAGIAHRVADDALGQLRLSALRTLRNASVASREARSGVFGLAGTRLATARATLPALRSRIEADSRHALEIATRASTEAWTTVSGEAAKQASLARGLAGERREAIANLARRGLADAREQCEATMREVAAQGPAKTLARGFAIVRDHAGRAVIRVADAADLIEIEFGDGVVEASVIAAQARPAAADSPLMIHAPEDPQFEAE